MEEKVNDFIERMTKYERWFYSSRCKHCNNEPEIIVNRTGKVEWKVLRGTRVPMYPSYTADICYYHRKKKEGRFGE